MTKHIIKVAEMFAGVGGFHLGLKRASSDYKVVWANQYEPERKKQFAYEIYRNRFPDTYISNVDISKVEKSKIPDINLVVGGFPCQDYSVMSTAAKGLYGKKGVLWWDIKDVIEEKWPQFLFLENVDRLLKSPGVAKEQPGRDFGMILKTLSELGYSVQWKMINAADYGFPQRRRRTFIFATREDTHFSEHLRTAIMLNKNQLIRYIATMAPLSSSLPVKELGEIQTIDLSKYGTLAEFSKRFKVKYGFRQTGIMSAGKVFMADYAAKSTESVKLRSIVKSNLSDQSQFLSDEQKARFSILKAGFRAVKTSRTGFEYKYGMGGIDYPDSLDKPARTMVTSEHTISRTTHVIIDPGNGRERLLTPEEAEQINTFPEGWTKLAGVTDSERFFTMGNALVVNLVRDIAIEIDKIAEGEDDFTRYRGNRRVQNIEH